MNRMQETEPLTRSAALKLIHLGQITTRAELTEALGVARATSGAVLDDLRARGLIEVSAPAGSGTLGRPSHQVRIAPDGPVAVAADLQPDGFRAGLLGLGGALVAATSGPLHNPDDPTRAVADVVAAAGDLARRSGRRCVGLGLAVPSAVTGPDGAVASAFYVKWADGTLLRAILAAEAERVGLAVPRCVVGNDINLAALAEHRHGSGREAGHLLVIASGHRGTGGAFVLDGRLYTGRSGLAMEAGHVTVNPGGLPCRCGNRGCLDVETDPLLFMELAGRAPAAGRPVLAQAVELVRDGSSRVRAVADRFASLLASAVADLINVLEPDRVLLGGLHGALLEVMPEAIGEAVARRTPWGRGKSVPLLPCVLADAPLIGAGELAWQPVLDDPASLDV
jgi:predicted NBD/HSP70 family sugar kinase